MEPPGITRILGEYEGRKDRTKMAIRKKVKITATVTATAYVKEYDNGEFELDELDEVLDVEDYEVMADLD